MPARSVGIARASSHALASALMPTDVETMDAEMAAAVSVGRQSARLAGTGVIAAWRQGHEAARQPKSSMLRSQKSASLSTAQAGRRCGRGSWGRDAS